MNFVYEAVAPSGRTFRGIEAAASEAALERILQDRGLLPVAISAEVGRRSRAPRAGRRRAAVEGVRYLSTLLSAGFPLDRALDTVARLAGHPVVSRAFREAGDAVRGGQTLASAMSAHPRVFPGIAVGMVEAGERGGRQAEALGRLAGHLEREEALRGQVVSALIYPALMAVVGGAAMAVMVFYVLPRFVLLLEDAGAGLPRSTEILMATGAVLSARWPVILGGFSVALASLGVYRRSTGGRIATDRFLARLPVLGAVRRNLAAARLGRTLESLLNAGLPLTQALDVAAGTLVDAGASEDVSRAREEVVTGGALAAALGRARAFPYLFLQMVALGEESGRLEEMLERGATISEEQVERSLGRLVRLLEPALIVTFGIVAGFVAMSLLQAIYGMRIEGFSP